MERELIGGLGVLLMITLLFLRVPVAFAMLVVGWGGGYQSYARPARRMPCFRLTLFECC